MLCVVSYKVHLILQFLHQICHLKRYHITHHLHMLDWILLDCYLHKKVKDLKQE